MTHKFIKNLLEASYLYNESKKRILTNEERNKLRKFVHEASEDYNYTSLSAHTS